MYRSNKRNLGWRQGFGGLIFLYSLKQLKYMRFPKEKCYCEKGQIPMAEFKKF